MCQDFLFGGIGVHGQLMMAKLLAECPAGGFFVFFGLENEQGFIFVSLPPAGQLMIPHPTDVLHGGKDRNHLRGEGLQDVEIHGLVGIEAVNGVQIAGKAADLVDVQELVFQREGIELGLELFDGDILFLALIVIPGIQRDSEVIDIPVLRIQADPEA